MHPSITQEISRLQVDERVSHARLARLARPSAPARRAERLRARTLRPSVSNA